MTLEPGYHDLEEGDVVKHVNDFDVEVSGSVVRAGDERIIVWDDGVWQWANTYAEGSRALGVPYTVERAA